MKQFKCDFLLPTNKKCKCQFNTIENVHPRELYCFKHRQCWPDIYNGCNRFKLETKNIQKNIPYTFSPVTIEEMKYSQQYGSNHDLGKPRGIWYSYSDEWIVYMFHMNMKMEDKDEFDAQIKPLHSWKKYNYISKYMENDTNGEYLYEGYYYEADYRIISTKQETQKHFHPYQSALLEPVIPITHKIRYYSIPGFLYQLKPKYCTWNETPNPHCVLFIQNLDDLLEFRIKYKLKDRINWQQVSIDYGGIYLGCFDEVKNEYMGSNYTYLMSFDLNSGCVWDPNALDCI
jgi:hypothetical protein